MMSEMQPVPTNTGQDITRIVMGSFMVFAGVSHLTFARDEFQAQVPKWLPDDDAFMDFVVVSSGVVEISLGTAMLLAKQNRVETGLALASFFVAIFPGNISQYQNRIDAFGLDTDRKRLIRLFFQPVLVAGALWSTGALSRLLARR